MIIETGKWLGMDYTIELENDEYVCYLTGTQTEAISRSSSSEKYYSRAPYSPISTKYHNVDYTVTTVHCNCKLSDCSSLFYGCSNLLKIIFGLPIDTIEVLAMNSMFEGCKNLYEIKNLDLLNTSNVTTMYNMFYNCNSLASLDLGGKFDTSNVTTMYGMFYSCKQLITLDLSSFNTQNVKNMQSMFSWCTKLATLNVSNFSTRNVEDMSHMFSQCEQLITLDLSSFNTPNVKDIGSMFNSCTQLTILDISNFNTQNVEDMSHMFAGCSQLVTLDLSHFNTRKVTAYNHMFARCESLIDINLSSFETGLAEDLNSMFDRCKNLTSLDLSHFDVAQVENCAYLFWDCENLQNINIKTWKLKRCRNFSYMFCDCSKLEKIDLRKWKPDSDIYNVAMTRMFAGCSNLKEIILGHMVSKNIWEWNFATNDIIYEAKTPNVYTWDVSGYDDYRHWESIGLPWLPIGRKTVVNQNIVINNDTNNNRMKLIAKWALNSGDKIHIYNINSDGDKELIDTLDGDDLNLDEWNTYTPAIEQSWIINDCVAIEIQEDFEIEVQEGYGAVDFDKEPSYGYYFKLTDNLNVQREEHRKTCSSLEYACVAFDDAFLYCSNLEKIHFSATETEHRRIPQEAMDVIVNDVGWCPEGFKMTRLRSIKAQ